MSPGPSATSSATGVDDRGDLVAVGVGVRVVGVDDRAVPDLDRVGAPADLDDRDLAPSTLKCLAIRSTSMVAEVMTSFRSGRRGSSRAR